MAKKLILGLILALLAQICPTPTPHPQFYLFILPLLDVRHCCKLSLCAISGKTNKPNMRKWQKPIFRPNFGPFGLKSGHHFFSLKIWLCQSLDIMVSYHRVQYQKKLMIQSWEKLVKDGQTDSDRQTNEGDFIGCCLTYVKIYKECLWFYQALCS